MGDFGLKKNASGYADPTAYQAIQNADIPKSGEIYSIYNAKKMKEEECLIIKANAVFCNVLWLTDVSSPDCIAVNSRIIKYTDPRMLSYTFTKNPMTYLKTISEDCLAAIMEAIEDHFNITIELVKNEIESDPAAPEQPVAVQNDNSELTMELAKAQSERDVYKDMYNNLLERMLA